MHYANERTSPRLIRTLRFLRAQRHPVSTRQIAEGAHVLAVSAIIAELRAQGHHIQTHSHGTPRRWFYAIR